MLTWNAELRSDGTRRALRLTSCPVLVFADPDDDDPEPCGADMVAELHIHHDGAEYGVWVIDMSRAPQCGHAMTDIARAEQRSILGIDGV